MILELIIVEINKKKNYFPNENHFLTRNFDETIKKTLKSKSFQSYLRIRLYNVSLSNFRHYF